MTQITTREELRAAIAVLELEQARKAAALKQDFATVYQSISTASILKTIVGEFVSPPSISATLLKTAATMAAGYYSRKQGRAGQGSMVKDIFGAIMENGMANIIASNAEMIKNTGRYLFHKLFNRSK